MKRRDGIVTKQLITPESVRVGISTEGVEGRDGGTGRSDSAVTDPGNNRTASFMTRACYVVLGPVCVIMSLKFKINRYCYFLQAAFYRPQKRWPF